MFCFPVEKMEEKKEKKKKSISSAIIHPKYGNLSWMFPIEKFVEHNMGARACSACFDYHG
jgi:hypothetical protein